MVPMSGAIMPEPLAMPPMMTGAPPMRTVRVEPLGKVSVVMIARAASSQARPDARATAPGSASMILS